MKKIKVNHFIEYSSSALILSYFFIHNIYLVLIGIIFSLYLININFINRFLKYLNDNFAIKNDTKELSKSEKEIRSNEINNKSTKEEKKLTLVETIEEYGFIPSIDENKENNAA